ncbi:MAG: hypothetical protein AAGK79_17375 [Pseudomonadota bacterium]
MARQQHPDPAGNPGVTTPPELAGQRADEPHHSASDFLHEWITRPDSRFVDEVEW